MALMSVIEGSDDEAGEPAPKSEEEITEATFPPPGELIPHAPPALLIERVLRLDPAAEIVCQAVIPADHPLVPVEQGRALEVRARGGDRADTVDAAAAVEVRRLVLIRLDPPGTPPRPVALGAGRSERNGRLPHGPREQAHQDDAPLAHADPPHAPRLDGLVRQGPQKPGRFAVEGQVARRVPLEDEGAEVLGHEHQGLAFARHGGRRSGGGGGDVEDLADPGRPVPGEAGRHDGGAEPAGSLMVAAVPLVAARGAVIDLRDGAGVQGVPTGVVERQRADGSWPYPNPEWRGRVVHAVYNNPSREDLPAYREYTARVERLHFTRL